MKRKNYESKDGKPFEWICTEEKAAEMLICLIVDKPNSAIPYLKTLIFADSLDEFVLKPNQRKLLNAYNKQVYPDYCVAYHPSKNNETPIQRFNRWLNSSSDHREFKPQALREGQQIKALADLVQFEAKSDAVAALVLPPWITDKSVRQELMASGVMIDENNIDRLSNLTLHFGNGDKAIDYETVCKGIELGLLSVERN
ncbi:MAG: hypothetical protein ACWIPH_09560 [Ostreibacterium sp.]